jgi:hypothetical protein
MNISLMKWFRRFWEVGGYDTQRHVFLCFYSGKRDNLCELCVDEVNEKHRVKKL